MTLLAPFLAIISFLTALSVILMIIARMDSDSHKRH